MLESADLFKVEFYPSINGAKSQHLSAAGLRETNPSRNISSSAGSNLPASPPVSDPERSLVGAHTDQPGEEVCLSVSGAACSLGNRAPSHVSPHKQGFLMNSARGKQISPHQRGRSKINFPHSEFNGLKITLGFDRNNAAVASCHHEELKYPR